MIKSEITLFIVDDEPLARARIKQALMTMGFSFDVQEATNGVEALALMSHTKGAIVLLDIEMPQLTGFDVIRQMDMSRFSVIFQTAFDEFAIQAFDHNACDYILKPFSDDRLKQALLKALDRFRSNQMNANSRGPQNPINGLIHQLSTEKKFMSRVVVHAGAKSILFETADILYFSSEDHVTYCHLKDVRYAMDLSLKQLEERLDLSRFVRIHRNSLVNWDYVAGFESSPTPKLLLKHGQKLGVARDRIKMVRTRLEGSLIS